MDIHLLVKLTARAWSLDILAVMGEGVPGRQAALLHATGAGRTAFAQSLQHLTEIGLVERNPGHGHPLRPEYRLTPAGHIAAAMAARVRAVTEESDALRLRRRTWTLPILAMSGEPRFFAEFRSVLAPITDRALSQALKALDAESWVARRVDPEAYPLRPQYLAVGTGAALHDALGLRF